MEKKRTNQQNKAIHLWFSLLAKYLNENGFDMKKTLRADFDIMWTPYNVKEFMCRPVQKAVCGKKSSKDITTSEINKCFDIINKAIGERTGLHLPFPCIEQLMENVKSEQDN